MNSEGNWRLHIEPAVLKTAQKFPRKDADRILDIIHNLPFNLYAGDVKKLGGEENTWRRRIGSYRIFYKLFPEKKIILVFHLERRTSATY